MEGTFCVSSSWQCQRHPVLQNAFLKATSSQKEGTLGQFVHGPQPGHTGGDSVGHKCAVENTGWLEKGADQNLFLVQRSKKKGFSSWSGSTPIVIQDGGWLPRKQTLRKGFWVQEAPSHTRASSAPLQQRQPTACGAGGITGCPAVRGAGQVGCGRGGGTATARTRGGAAGAWKSPCRAWS